MLAAAGGNKSEAARRLDISRPRLQRLLDGLTDD
jgi:ActR/RegA family two-component response regulator